MSKGIENGKSLSSVARKDDPIAKTALVVGVNDYSNWNDGVGAGGLTLNGLHVSWCVAESSSFTKLLQDGLSSKREALGRIGIGILARGYISIWAARLPYNKGRDP